MNNHHDETFINVLMLNLSDLPRGYMLLQKAGSPTVLFRLSEDISLPINSQRTFSDGMQGFLKKWHAFLK